MYHGARGGVHARVYELAEAFIEIADHDTFRHEIFEFVGIKAAELCDIRGDDAGVEEELDRVLGERLGLCYAAEDLLAVGLVVDELPCFEVLSCDEGESGLVVAEHDSEGCWGHGIDGFGRMLQTLCSIHFLLKFSYNIFSLIYRRLTLFHKYATIFRANTEKEFSYFC